MRDKCIKLTLRKPYFVFCRHYSKRYPVKYLFYVYIINKMTSSIYLGCSEPCMDLQNEK